MWCKSRSIGGRSILSQRNDKACLVCAVMAERKAEKG